MESVNNELKKPTRFICPLCGGRISELPTFFGCDNYRVQDGGCQFKVFKNIFGIPIPNTMIEELLWVGETKEKLNGFYDKKTKETFSARLRYDKRKNALLFVRDEEEKESSKGEKE